MICGIDEAGRGCLAGPVCAAAVILPETFDIPFLNDSKKLSEKKREQTRAAILNQALFWHIGWASAEEIDRINILQATLAAMERAFSGMLETIQHEAFPLGDQFKIIVDGNQIPPIEGDYSICAEPKADAVYPAVMAASILAKTSRDHLMYTYHQRYPQYRYDLHKGYGTALHRRLIAQYGNSPIQRHSFKIRHSIEAAL
ncbi:MAG: ribonuclease HII [Treponema sp.]